MVNRLLAAFILLFGLLHAVPGWTAGAPFSASVKSQPVEYGKRIDLELQTRHAKPGLDSVDLSPLAADFVVRTPDNVYAPDDGSARQRWRLRLYPRRPGQLRIPELFFRGTRSEAIPVEVTEPLDGEDGSPITVSSRLGDTEVWVKQPVPISMTIETGSRHTWLETDTARESGFEIVELPRAQRTFTRNGEQRTRHRLSWMVYPQRSGAGRVQLPAVKYRRDGVTTHRFHPPALTMRIRELPPYVPPAMAVGRLQLEASRPEQLFFVKRELAFLSLRITGGGPSGRYPSELLRQLKSSRAITFYPSQTRDDGATRAEDAVDVRVLQIPFAPEAAGLLALPPLRLPYFDPATGKIETEVYPLGKIVSLPLWLVYAGWAAVALGALALSRLAYRRLRRQWQLHRGYQRALHRLQRAANPAAAKSALMEVAAAERWPTNITLAAWQRRWLADHPRLPSPAGGVSHLQAWHYGKTEATLDEVRRPLIAAFYRRMPLLRMLAAVRKASRARG